MAVIGEGSCRVDQSCPALESAPGGVYRHQLTRMALLTLLLPAAASPWAIPGTAAR
jgi:hypothetical protein